MKFSKVLQRLTSELPELEQMFLGYKSLKKQLKAMKQQDPADKHETAEDGKVQLSAEEEKFIQSLNQELDKFNKFFMEREEEAVIQLQVLAERLAKDRSPEALSSLVDFHGHAVLLLHWSLLNYAAVAKILKKHDKRTGVLLRAPYLASCLQQPFNSTAIMSKLVKRAEELLQEKLPQVTPSVDGHSDAATSTQVTAALSDDETASSLMSDSALFRRTRLALETWNTLKTTAATPSTVLKVPPPGTRLLPGLGLATSDVSSILTSSSLGSRDSVQPQQAQLPPGRRGGSGEHMKRESVSTPALDAILMPPPAARVCSVPRERGNSLSPADGNTAGANAVAASAHATAPACGDKRVADVHAELALPASKRLHSTSA